jgi:20S proteasome alpha/beta subunit
MTTILGIKTNVGQPGIVIAADTTVSVYDDGGEILGKEKTCKIRVGKNNVMAFAGTIDNYLENFFNYVSGEKNYSDFVNFVSDGLEKKTAMVKNPILEAIKTNYFAALNMFNRYQTKRNEGSVDDAIDLIMATNKPNLNLYHVDAFGNLVKPSRQNGLEYVCAGSGSKQVTDFFHDEEYLNDADFKTKKIKIDNITMSAAIQLATKAMKKATKDSETGDLLDLVVIRKNKIDNYCSEVLQAVDKFYDRVMDKYI